MSMQVIETIPPELLAKLTPKQREIVECLPATVGEILLETKRHDDNVSRNTVYKFISAINKRLAKYGVKVVMVGSSYRLLEVKNDDG